LNNDFINLGEHYTAENVKKANRKRIAMAQETLRAFNPVQKHIESI